MKKGIIVSFRRLKFLDYVTLNKIFILIFVFFISGIIIGSVVINKNGFFLDNTNIWFKDFIILHSNNTFLKKLCICVIKYLIILILYFLSGTTMLGVAVIPFIVFWQGIVTGSLISYLYSSYGLTGIAFNAVILIPPIAIFTICCFFAAKNSINYSLNIVKLTLPKNSTVNLFLLFKNYCYKYLIFLGITFICTLLEVLLNKLFLKFFNF